MDPFKSACIDVPNFDPIKCTDVSSQVRNSVNHFKAVIGYLEIVKNNYQVAEYLNLTHIESTVV